VKILQEKKKKSISKGKKKSTHPLKSRNEKEEDIYG
jgi:hypothetical protein